MDSVRTSRRTHCAFIRQTNRWTLFTRASSVAASKQLGRSRATLTSKTLVLHHAYAFQRNRVTLTFTINAAVARINAKTLVLLQWPWQKAMEAAGGDRYCSATVAVAVSLEVSSQIFHRLLTHGQPCGSTTSVPAIHTQVAWQDTRKPDVKSRSKFLRCIFPHHTNCLYLFGHCCC
jgi:hypothetical protein